MAVAVHEVAQRRRLVVARRSARRARWGAEPLVDRAWRWSAERFAGRDEVEVERRGLDLPEPERPELEVHVRVATVIPAA